ncbi:MAG: cystathionine beta-lyase [Thermodesulfobacteriota bacterium]
MKDQTRLVTLGRDSKHNHGIVNPPVYHASTVLFPTWQALKTKDQRPGRNVNYGLHGTPTQFALEDALTGLDGGFRAKLFPSGQAAVAAAILAVVQAGDHALIADSVYGPTRNFCDTYFPRFNIEHDYYDPLIGAGISECLRPNTRLVYVESPGSNTFEVQDVPAIAAALKPSGVKVVMDNTWASPLYFKPFTQGVDLSVQAITKYISGHSDVMMGAVTATEEAWPEVEKTARLFGQCAAPDDCYLALRGLRTLAVRLRYQQQAALALARWFEARPEVARVLHPALPGCPGHEYWKRDFTGATGLFGVLLKPRPEAALASMFDGFELFGLGYSWGGYESLLIPTGEGTRRSIGRWHEQGALLRVQVGLEAVEDLIADLEAGFTRLSQYHE